MAECNSKLNFDITKTEMTQVRCLKRLIDSVWCWYKCQFTSAKFDVITVDFCMWTEIIIDSFSVCANIGTKRGMKSKSYFRERMLRCAVLWTETLSSTWLNCSSFAFKIKTEEPRVHCTRIMIMWMICRRRDECMNMM